MHREIGGGCLFAFLFAILGSFLVSGCYGCSQMTTAEGYRDGTVRKLSESGLFWKTWEAETLGDGMRLSSGEDGNRAYPETFTYSVSDPAVLEQIKAIPPGKRVRIHYHKFAVVWPPRGETRYFITRVELIP